LTFGSLALALVSLLFPFLFSLLVLLALFLSSRLPSGLLLFSFLLILFFSDLALKFACLLLDHPQLLPDSFALSSTSGRLSSVLLVRLGTANPFFFCRLVTDLNSPQVADVLLDGARVNQGSDDFLDFLVHATAIQSAINKGGSLAAFYRQELGGVSFHFLLGNFDDGPGHVGFVVLFGSQFSAAQRLGR
jgi:hypothetical protein